MSDIARWVDQVIEEAVERCTRCGKCAAVCPTAKETGLDLSAPEKLVQGLIALSRANSTEWGASGGDAARWLAACDQSGQCSAACPEGINVRQWIATAGQRVSLATRDEAARKGEAARRFRAMSHAVRLLASMQMPSEALERITRPAERRKAELLFYTGCNLLKTSHIVFNVMDILEALEVDYDVVGGPSHCCGVYQFNAGDQTTYENIGGRTFQRFGQSGAQQVLTWCPTCTKNFDEIEADRAPPSFELDHITSFLAAQLDRLRPLFRDQPPRRAVIHEHQGIAGTRESVRALMASVPNLTVVELPQDSGFSYACGGFAARYVEREQAIHRNMAEGAVASGADLLITTYHSCHRALAGAEAHYPFRVANFTDVLAEALGRGCHPDYFKMYKSGGEMAEAVAAAKRYLESNGVKVSQSTLAAIGDELFAETGLAAGKDAFVEAFAEVAQPS
jgi:Fe-S oxidoreductase